MKKLLKIPALLLALMLIVSSCGKDAISDAQYLVDSVEVLESMRDNIRPSSVGPDNNTLIKLNEELIEYNKKLIKTLAYYVYEAAEHEFDIFILYISKFNKQIDIADHRLKKEIDSKKDIEKIIEEIKRMSDRSKEMIKNLEKDSLSKN